MVAKGYRYDSLVVQCVSNAIRTSQVCGCNAAHVFMHPKGRFKELVSLNSQHHSQCSANNMRINHKKGMCSSLSRNNTRTASPSTNRRSIGCERDLGERDNPVVDDIA